MTTIYLDPVQMDTTAGHIGEHAREIQASAGTLESACTASVPVSLAGWLAEELHGIAVHAQLVALVYTVAALDTALRAQQIQTDQSLATAIPSLASTTPTFTGAPLVGGIAPFAASTATTGTLVGSSIPDGFVLGAAPTSSYVPLPGQQEGFMLGSGGPNVMLGGATGSLGGSSSGSFIDRLLLSTPGRTYIGNNVYTGSGMTGSFSSVLPDPDSDY